MCQLSSQSATSSREVVPKPANKQQKHGSKTAPKGCSREVVLDGHGRRHAQLGRHLTHLRLTGVGNNVRWGDANVISQRHEAPIEDTLLLVSFEPNGLKPHLAHAKGRLVGQAPVPHLRPGSSSGGSMGCLHCRLCTVQRSCCPLEWNDHERKVPHTGAAARAQVAASNTANKATCAQIMPSSGTSRPLLARSPCPP